MKTRLAVLCVTFLAACAAPKTIEPLAIPLQYSTSADAAEAIPHAALPNCSGIATLDVKDGRGDKSLGTRWLEEHPDQRAPVTAQGDIAAWASTGAEAALKRVAVPLSGSGKGTLRITLDSIKTEENVFRRSGYSARIAMAAELVNGSKSCWKGDAAGEASNYGYSGSVLNYQETLNHALERATIDLLDKAAFREAACNCR